MTSPGQGWSGARRLAAAAVAAAALSACSIAPLRLDRAQLARRADEDAAPAPAPAPARDAPRVWVAAVEDRRADPSALGQVGGRPIGSTDVAGWIEQEIGALASPRYAIATGPGGEAGARLALRPRVLKAYVSTIDVVKTATLVLEVEIASPGGRETRIYRGQQTSLNWVSGEGEIVTALQQAAAKCLGQLRADLEARLAPAGGVPSPRPSRSGDAEGSPP